jgi:hypothetical protein
MLKTMFGVSLGALALVVAPSASATTFHIGDVPNFYITSGTPFSSSITANFGNGFSTKMPFDDSFEFTIPTQSGIGSGSISTSFSSKLNHLKISDLWINGVHYVVPANPTGQSLTVGGIPIFAGVLNTIRVAGISGKRGGSYAGTATFSAFTSTVPEPASWALMLAGFGFLGAVARRRTAVSYS